MYRFFAEDTSAARRGTARRGRPLQRSVAPRRPPWTATPSDVLRVGDPLPCSLANAPCSRTPHHLGLQSWKPSRSSGDSAAGDRRRRARKRVRGERCGQMLDATGAAVAPRCDQSEPSASAGTVHVPIAAIVLVASGPTRQASHVRPTPPANPPAPPPSSASLPPVRRRGAASVWVALEGHCPTHAAARRGDFGARIEGRAAADVLLPYVFGAPVCARFTRLGFFFGTRRATGVTSGHRRGDLREAAVSPGLREPGGRRHAHAFRSSRPAPPARRWRASGFGTEGDSERTGAGASAASTADGGRVGAELLGTHSADIARGRLSIGLLKHIEVVCRRILHRASSARTRERAASSRGCRRRRWTGAARPAVPARDDDSRPREHRQVGGPCADDAAFPAR